MVAKKISIIIPVYNVEKYIDECVCSVLNQTYSNLEVILVDDASPDRCPKLCDKYATEDQRVTVVHQKNMGLSGARNTGLRYATGEYVLFLDSDDYLDKEFCKKAIKTAEEAQADIVVGEISSVDENGKHLEGDNNLHFERNKVLDNSQAMQSLIEQTNMKGYAWGKLYRREIAEGIEYPVGKVYEDRFTVPKYFFRAKRVCLCNGAVTFYRMRDTSISHEVSMKKLDDLLEAEEWMITFCKEHYAELVDTMESVYFGRYIHLWIMLYDAGQKSEAKALAQRMKKVYKNYADHPGIRKAHKISYRFIFFAPGLYRWMLHVMKVEQ